MDDFIVRDWTDIQGYQVYPWSIAGNETCIVVKTQNNIKMAFDMGYACHQSVQCDHVFISHGHMDHISGLPNHAAKRGLRKQKPANYYVPEVLTHRLLDGVRIFCSISETKREYGNTKIVPIYAGEKVELGKGYFAIPFPTVHRVPNMGYIVYKKHAELKPEFKGRSNEELQQELHNGVDIHDVVTTPEIAYTGDTTFEIFENPPKDFLNVKLLIMEVTYIHQEFGKDMVASSRERGHVHLSEVINHAHLFENVGTILMVHFSDQYSASYIKDNVFPFLPACLQSKVKVSTLAKEKQ